MRAVQFTPEAQEQARALDVGVQRRLMKILKEAAAGLFEGKELGGELLGCKSLRSGRYRAVYIESSTSLQVISVGHRRTVYAKASSDERCVDSE